MTPPAKPDAYSAHVGTHPPGPSRRSRPRAGIPAKPRLVAAAVRRRGVLRAHRRAAVAVGVAAGAGLRSRLPAHPAVVAARPRYGSLVGARGHPGPLVRRAGRRRGAVATPAGS